MAGELADGPARHTGSGPGTVITVCAQKDATVRDVPGGDVTLASEPHGAELTTLDDPRNTTAWVYAQTAEGTRGFVLREVVNSHC